MVRNKNRIYITLDTRPKLRTYHWAITRSPKVEHRNNRTESTRYHARNFVNITDGRWEYQRIDLPSTGYGRTLVPILIGKIGQGDKERVGKVLEQIPLVQDDPSWNCVCWVETAVTVLSEAGCIRAWNGVRLRPKLGGM